MFHHCPFGGLCADYGSPSDCEVNMYCVNFKTEEEKKRFDSLPDQFLLINGGTSIRFKNFTQVKFFLTDAHESWRNGEFYILQSDGNRTELLPDMLPL